MRSIWKGSITFGLVSVPVKLYGATEDHNLSLHQVHDADGGRIRYQRRCEVCGKVVDYADIDKAYDDGSTTVVLTDDDLASLPEERSRSIEVSQFVPRDQLDPIRFDRSYFLEPDKAAVKPYRLLRDALEESDRTAIVTFSLRQKTRLGALRVRESVIMLQSLLWDDEVREADFPVLDTETKVSKSERQMASSLIDTMSGDFRPDAFTDDYQEQLRLLIKAKLSEGEAVDTAATFGEEDEEAEPGQVIDLVEALRRSIDEVGGRRGGKKATSGKKDGAKKSSGAKKAATTKSSGKKSTAKKSGAKKTSKRPAKKAS